MLTKYIQAAMQQAKYENLPDDGTFYGGIPICEGVCANAPTLEACREELQEVLEDWILLSLTMNLPLPTIDGIDFPGWLPVASPASPPLILPRLDMRYHRHCD